MTSKRVTILLGVGLSSASALLTQIAFTRIFSITLWHHFAYLAVGLALLGFGAAGSLLTARGGALLPKDGSLDATLARRARWAAFAVFFSVAGAAAVRCNSLQVMGDPSSVAGLALITILTTLPFFGVGMVIATALAGVEKGAGPVYAADLVGAGIGAAAVIPLIPILGGPGLVFASALAVAFAAFLFSLRAGVGEMIWSLVVLVVLGAAFYFVGDDERWVTPALKKEIHQFQVIDHSEWTPLARLDVSQAVDFKPAFGGEFGKESETLWRVRGVTQDGAAPTVLFRVEDNQHGELPFLRTATQAAAWRALAAGDAAPSEAQALVIGVGGGIDVMIALAHGAKHVDGAEINQGMIDLLEDQYKEFTGDLPGRPDVNIVRAEGRHFVASTDKHYDVIQMSGVDTYAASASGANSLAEAYLYTVEAFDNYLDRLSDGGIVCVSRFVMNEAPRETLRLSGIAAEALRQRDVDEPEKCIAIIGGNFWASVMVCERGFSEAQLEAIRTHAGEQGFNVLFDPSNPGERAYDQLLRSSPEERAEFVADYPYLMEPATDDRPFFFNYFRWDKLSRLKDLRSDNTEVPYTTTIPIAHGILFLTLLVTVLLGLAGILRPLRGLGNEGKGRGVFSLFFACLGVAFLFVEIGFLQRLTFFLGHPTYALSVVLTGLLLSSGLGAALSSRLGGIGTKVLPVILALAILGAGWVSEVKLADWIGFEHYIRVIIALAFVVPLGFLMGMPFPYGLERLRAVSPGLVPWAFAVNAFFTVLASAVATLVAMEFGFRALFATAAGTYILAFLALAMAPRPRRQPPVAEAPAEEATS